MKKNLSVLFLLLFFLFTFFSCRRSIPTLQGDWKQQASFIGQPRVYPVCFVIGNFAYVGTGYSPGTQTYWNDFYKYDIVNDKWTQIASMPALGRQEAVAFASGGFGYVGTGYNGTLIKYFKDFYQYDPNANKWTRVADLPGPLRKGATAFVINDTAYVGTGLSVDTANRQIPTQFFSRWNKTSLSWDSTVAPYSGPQVYGAFSFVLSDNGHNQGFVAGGFSGSLTTNRMYEYNSYANKWTKKANIDSNISQLKRGDAVAFTFNNTAWVATGAASAGGSQADAYQYNLQQDTWIQVNSFEGGGRSGAIGFSLPSTSSYTNNGYLGYLGLGGVSAGGIDFWSFNPYVPQILNN